MTIPTPSDEVEKIVEELIDAVTDYNCELAENRMTAGEYFNNLERDFKATLQAQQTKHTAEVEEILAALSDMYGQYCSDDYGHQFMSAGENACLVLEKYTDMTFDDVGKQLTS